MSFRKVIRFLCLALLCSPLARPVRAEDFTNALQAYLQQCVHAEVPTGCIVVGLLDEHGKRVVSCGTLDNGTEQQANGDTVFGLHSMTGTFTRLLLQDMAERGEMSLNDPAAKYLPLSVKLPTHEGKEITIRHLAEESSGLPDPRGIFKPKRAEEPLADFTTEKMDALVSSCQLTAAPGTKSTHGSVDKGLLGQAMALRTKTDYESLLLERICGPLAMNSTRCTLSPELKARAASEHNGFGYAVPSCDWGALKPLAGLYSTANDLLTFLSALELAPSSLTPLLERNIDSCFSVHGKRIFDTGGGWFGCRAYACYDKERRRGVVVLSTSANLMRNFGDYLLASEWESSRRPKQARSGSQPFDAYAGQFRLKPASKLSSFFGHENDTNFPAVIGLRQQGGRLFAQAIGAGLSPTDPLLLPPITGELLPQSETRFFERLSGQPVTFSRDARDKIIGLTLPHDGKTVSYEKVSEQPPNTPAPVKPHVAIKLPPKLLDACVGQYEFPGAPAVERATIWREGDQLLGQVSGKNALKGAFGIYPKSETNFFLKINGAQLTFIKNDKGAVTGVVHHSSRPGVPDFEGKKVKD